MKAIVATDRTAGPSGLSETDLPYPHAAENDVIVRVHAAGFTPGELNWPGTWEDRSGRPRTPSVPGHEFAGEVAELGYGTSGFTLGQRVFGMVHWTRNGALAEYVAVETNGLAALPADVEYVTAASLPISGLTAHQALFDHAQLQSGQTIIIHGVTGGVGSFAAQMARDAGARVIGTGRAGGEGRARELGVSEYIDLDALPLEQLPQVDVVLDVLGGTVLDRSAALVRPGGTLVSIAEPLRVHPENARGIFFVVEAHGGHLLDIVEKVRSGRLISHIGTVRPLSETALAFAPPSRVPGKTIIRIT